MVVFGSVLDSILLHTCRSQRLPRRLWPIVESQAECATHVWREPDRRHPDLPIFGHPGSFGEPADGCLTIRERHRL